MTYKVFSKNIFIHLQILLNLLTVHLIILSFFLHSFTYLSPNLINLIPTTNKISLLYTPFHYLLSHTYSILSIVISFLYQLFINTLQHYTQILLFYLSCFVCRSISQKIIITVYINLIEHTR